MKPSRINAGLGIALVVFGGYRIASGGVMGGVINGFCACVTRQVKMFEFGDVGKG